MRIDNTEDDNCSGSECLGDLGRVGEASTFPGTEGGNFSFNSIRFFYENILYRRRLF